MRQNERQSKERRGWASYWGFTNCHSEEGERTLFKEWSHWPVLWIRSLFLSPYTHSPACSPPPPSRQEQNKLCLLGEEREKMCRVHWLLTAHWANQKDSHQEQACKVLQAHVYCVVHTGMSQRCLCVFLKHSSFPHPNQSHEFHCNVLFLFPCVELLFTSISHLFCLAKNKNN